MNIPQIGIRNIDIKVREINLPDISNWSSPILFSPPVTTQIGIPIVDMPGCVEAHNVSNPKNTQISNDDKRGVSAYCDAGVPSFNPIRYEPEQIILSNPAEVPKTPVEESEDKEQDKETSVNVEDLKIPPIKSIIECPTKKQRLEEPVGFIFDSGRKEIIGYKLKGIECVRIVKDVPITEQIVNAIPPAGTIMTTGSIALVATSSALLAKPFADILLKVVKPTVKKVVKKVAAIRGKKPKVLSLSERIVEQRVRNTAIKQLRQALKPK